MPRSSDTTTPPVRIAMSSSIAFLRSPKPGALTAATFKEPRKRFTTSVPKASPSTSSAMINKDFPDWTTGSKIGSSSFMLEIFFSDMRIKGFSISVIIFSALVTK